MIDKGSAFIVERYNLKKKVSVSAILYSVLK